MPDYVGIELKLPAFNLNRLDFPLRDFVIPSAWEDGSCQHLYLKLSPATGARWAFAIRRTG